MANMSSSQSPLRKKRSISSSLFSIFSKPNAERDRGYTEPQQPAPALAPVAMPPPDIPIERPSTRQSVRSNRSRAASRLSFTSRAESPPARELKRPSSRLSVLLNGGSKSETTTTPSQYHRPRTVTPWDPPPLFQAYPRAVKHTLLKTPGANYDSTRPFLGYHQKSQDTQVRRTSLLGRSKSRQGFRDGMGDNVVDRWGKKVFILVTSGHLLEYGGDGAYDRLPDKILKLGPESAAFASDLIPGFPYVLQVLQTASAGIQVVQLPQKSLRSRFGLQSSASRRQTTSLLLVFDEAEQMDSWMIAIRKEIEALGGKKSRPDSTIIARPFQEEAEYQSTASRYEGMQRSPSRQSTLTTRSTRTITNGDSYDTPPRMRAMPDRPLTSFSQRPPDMDSVSEVAESDTATDDNSAAAEAHALADNWFTDLPPSNSASNDRTTMPHSSQAKRSSSSELLPEDAPFMGLSQRQTSPQKSVRGLRSRTSNFSLPRRFSITSQTQARNFASPSIPESTLTPQHLNSSLGPSTSMQAYSDDSTASGQSYLEPSTTSELSSLPSTRTSTLTLPTHPVHQQQQHSMDQLDGSLFSSSPYPYSDSSTLTPTPTLRKPSSSSRTGTPISSSYPHNTWPETSFLTARSSQSPTLPRPQSPIFASATLQNYDSSYDAAPAPPNILRRPTSLLIHADPAPFLSAITNAKGSGTAFAIPRPASQQQHRIWSTQVPVVRPPSLRSSSRQNMRGNDGNTDRDEARSMSLRTRQNGTGNTASKLDDSRSMSLTMLSKMKDRRALFRNQGSFETRESMMAPQELIMKGSLMDVSSNPASGGYGLPPQLPPPTVPLPMTPPSLGFGGGGVSV